MMPVPRVAVGAIVRRGDTILLVQRGRPPAMGEWAVPGGKVAWGETLAAAVEREVLEETGCRVRAERPVYLFEHIEPITADGQHHFHYVIIDLAAEWLAGDPQAGDDAVAARWVRFDQLPTLPVNHNTLTALQQLFPERMPAHERIDGR